MGEGIIVARRQSVKRVERQIYRCEERICRKDRAISAREAKMERAHEVLSWMEKHGMGWGPIYAFFTWRWDSASEGRDRLAEEKDHLKKEKMSLIRHSDLIAHVALKGVETIDDIPW